MSPDWNEKLMSYFGYRYSDWHQNEFESDGFDIEL